MKRFLVMLLVACIAAAGSAQKPVPASSPAPVTERPAPSNANAARPSKMHKGKKSKKHKHHRKHRARKASKSNPK
jgi:hypothetical protein